jgi:hypothetical protein
MTGAEVAAIRGEQVWRQEPSLLPDGALVSASIDGFVLWDPARRKLGCLIPDGG